MRQHRLLHRFLLLGATALLVVAGGAAPALAVTVGAYPSWPISDALVGSPPVQAFPPAAGETPSAAEIADPVTPGASCGGWYPQGFYGDRWPAGATWWAYRCMHASSQYYPHPCPEVGACDAVCYGYPWDCYTVSDEWADYFYWDGADAVFYGEAYASSIDDGMGYSASSTYWWNAPTAAWYEIAPNAPPFVTFTVSCTELDCAFDASGSSDGDGRIEAYGWSFGDGTAPQTGSAALAFHAYRADGTYTVTLSGTDDQGASASVSHAVSVAANRPPSASFAFRCSGPSCSFDASGSADSDGTIAAYRWSFGDGTTSGGRLAQHAYLQPGTFTVILTVTDNAGAVATQSRSVTIIALAARAYRLRGVQWVDLAWSGQQAGATIEIYRDGTWIATVTESRYTDVVGKGAGSYAYAVCGAQSGTCSNEARVSF